AMEDATFGTGSQVVGDQVFFRKAGARLWQLFRNGGGPLTGVELDSPPETPFATPIVPGTCDASCKPNVAALEAACGVPLGDIVCDAARPIRAVPLADCEGDTIPGNQQCDLAPGVYGRVRVLNDARMALGPGQYTFCSFKVGRDAAVEANGTTILMPPGA